MATRTTSRTVKGQPGYINVDNKLSLVQDQILLYTTGDKKVSQSEGVVEIIGDVWADLLSPSGKSKPGNKTGWWYYEVEVTDTEDGDKDVKVKVDCPTPEPELFGFNFKPVAGDSDWAKYWKSVMLKTESSKYNSTNALQPKEITFPGSSYINQKGEVVEVPEVTVAREDLGDIDNLLASMY